MQVNRGVNYPETGGLFIIQADQSITFSLRNSLPYYKSKILSEQKIWKEKYKRGKPSPITQLPRTFYDSFSPLC